MDSGDEIVDEATGTEEARRSDERIPGAGWGRGFEAEVGSNIDRDNEIAELRKTMSTIMDELVKLRVQRSGRVVEDSVSVGENELDDRVFGREGGDTRSDRILNVELKLEKLGSTNFKSWKKELELTLKNIDLWDLVEGRRKFSGTRFERDYTEREKGTAYTILYKSIDQERKRLILHVDDVHEAWEILKRRFEPSDLITKGKAVDDLFSCKMGGGENMERYIMRVRDFYREFLRVGHKALDEQLLVHILLRGLSADFRYVTSMINTMNESDVSFERVCSILEAEWKGRMRGGGEFSRSEAYVSRREVLGQVGVSRVFDRRVCFRCGKSGHVRDNCRVFLGSKLGESSGGQSVSKLHRNNTVCLKLRENDRSALGSFSGWLLDSGATDHVSYDREDFVEFQEVSEFLVWGSDMRCEVKGRGKVIGEVRLGERVTVITLHDVLYVPDFACKIYSLGRGTSVGWKYVVGRKTMTGISEGQVLFVGKKMQEGFYVVDLCVTKGGKQFSSAGVSCDKGKKVNFRYSEIKKGDCDGSKKLVIDDVTGVENSESGVDVRGGAYAGVLSKGNSHFWGGPKVVLRGTQVSEEELTRDVLVENDRKISVDRVQMCNKGLNKKLMHARSVKQLSGESVHEKKVAGRDKISGLGVAKGVVVSEQHRGVDLGENSGVRVGCNKDVMRLRLEKSGFVDWDTIEELGDSPVVVAGRVMSEEDDSGDSGLSFRHRFRRGRRISERGKGEIIEA
jgi:hypothetical protein